MPEKAARVVAECRSTVAGQLRVALQYDGEDYAVLYRASDLEAAFTPEEFDRFAKTIVLKSFDDATDQPELAGFGHLDATFRWFHDDVVVQVPIEEWEGLVLVFDRRSLEDVGAFTDALLKVVEATYRTDDGPEAHLSESLEEQFD